MTMIDTPDGIAKFAWLQVIHALALEINTGMKFSNKGSLLDVLARRGYSGPTRGTKKNKHAGLVWAIEQLTTLDPTYTAKGTVARALEATP